MKDGRFVELLRIACGSLLSSQKNRPFDCLLVSNGPRCYIKRSVRNETNRISRHDRRIPPAVCASRWFLGCCAPYVPFILYFSTSDAFFIEPLHSLRSVDVPSVCQAGIFSFRNYFPFCCKNITHPTMICQLCKGNFSTRLYIPILFLELSFSIPIHSTWFTLQVALIPPLIACPSVRGLGDLDIEDFVCSRCAR